MKKTVNVYEFRDAFMAVRPDNFSYQGLEILFEYLEDLEGATGEEIELDVIALCCEWSELSHSDVISYYDVPEENQDNLIEWLSERTLVAGGTTESIIFMDF